MKQKVETKRPDNGIIPLVIYDTRKKKIDGDIITKSVDIDKFIAKWQPKWNSKLSGKENMKLRNYFTKMTKKERFKFNREIATEYADMLSESKQDVLIVIGYNERQDIFEYITPKELNEEDLEGIFERVLDIAKYSNEERKMKLN